MTSFVTGIDTDIGKTIAVGLLARFLAARGVSVITQKMVQTGSTPPGEDIIMHRKIMGMPLCDEDRSGETCPYVYPFASSPHLAAGKAGDMIEVGRITAATESLSEKYEDVIVEGAGGLQVPLNSELTILDYLSQVRYPTILVSSSRLGSINHTLMSLELLKSRGVPLLGIVYNRFGEVDSEIGEDSKRVFEEYLIRHEYPANVVELWPWSQVSDGGPDFTPFYPGAQS